MDRAIIIPILILSALLQLTAAYLAVRLIKVTASRKAWTLLALGIALMAIRRLISLFYILNGESPPPQSISAEAVALVTSGFMLFGINYIHPLFQSIQQAATELGQSEARYRSIFEKTRDAVLITRSDGRITDANPSAAALFGYNPADLIDGNIREVYLDPGIRDEFKEKISQQGFVEDFEVAFRGPDNRIIDCRLTSVLWRDEAQGMEGYLSLIRDETLRKKAVNDLRDSEQRFRSLIQSAGSAIICLAPDHRILEFNSEAEHIFNCSREEVLDRDYFDLFLPSSLHREIAGEIVKVVNGEVIRGFENEIQRPCGERRIMNWNVVRLPLNGKDEIGVLCAGHDVTERKLMESALRESENRLASIIRTVPDIIYRLDSLGIITFISDAVAGYGYEPAELLGAHIREIVHPDDWERAATKIMERRSGKRKKESAEIRLFAKPLNPPDGEIENKQVTRERTFLISAEGLYATDDSGRKAFSGTQGIVRDITERKKAQEAVRESEKRFRSLSENAPDIIFTLDCNGAFTYINSAWERLLGRRPSETLGRSPVQFGPLDQAEVFHKAIRQARNGRKTISDMLVKFNHADSSLHHFLFSAAPDYDESGQPAGLIGMMKDITAQYDLEAQLRESQKMEAIGVLTGGLVHDFNNILSAIMGYTDLAMSRLPDDADSKKYLEEVIKGSDRAQELVSRILSLGRKTEQVKAPVAVGSIITEALDLLWAALPTTIRIIKKIETEKDVILSDQTQIHQIVVNLCTNAAQAMQEKGGILEVGLKQVEIGPIQSPVQPKLNP